MGEISTEKLEQFENEFRNEEDSIRKMQDFEKPEKLYADLIKCVLKYHPSTDLSLIERAYHIADDAHKEQARKSGETYIINKLCVSIILAELELDKDTIV